MLGVGLGFSSFYCRLMYFLLSSLFVLLLFLLSAFFSFLLILILFSLLFLTAIRRFTHAFRAFFTSPLISSLMCHAHLFFLLLKRYHNQALFLLILIRIDYF